MAFGFGKFFKGESWFGENGSVARISEINEEITGLEKRISDLESWTVNNRHHDDIRILDNLRSKRESLIVEKEELERSVN